MIECAANMIKCSTSDVSQGGKGVGIGAGAESRQNTTGGAETKIMGEKRRVLQT